MDRNRKILIAIFALLILSSILAIVDISLKMQGVKREIYPFTAPQIGPGVGIIRITGPIMFTDDGDPFSLKYGSEAILKRLNELEEDDRIKAIIVRINSPGGTVAATQEIFQKLLKLRKKNIPLVASMGDIAASGGYYLASACNYIYANHGTITGSIGVIAVAPNLKGLFEKLGIKMNVIKSGKYKDLLASYRDISEEERELIQQMIDSSYQKFLKDVSLGRNIPIGDIEPYADGRVMNGSSALESKLIDGIGGLESALAKAKELAELPEDAAVYDEIRHPLEQFLMSMENAFMRHSDLERRLKVKHTMIEYRYQP
jgi:protease-4